LNIDIFIPVRLRSERLPKKGMRKINDKPIIKYLVERLEKTTTVRNLIICTTLTKTDDELVDYLIEEKISYFRGSEHDILDRYVNAAKKFNTDFIVNVEGDDIYTDPDCVDVISKEFLKTNADYLDIDSMPFGLSPSGIKVSALEKICYIKKSKNTETGYKRFFTESGLFKVKHINLENNLDFPKNTRLSLDYEEDFQLAEEIFKHLGNDFHKTDLLELFKQQSNLLDITAGLDERYNAYFKKNNVDISTKDI